MAVFPRTIIFRHRRENLKKCSLRGLEVRSDMRFFTYPQDQLPDFTDYILLSLDAPALSEADAAKGLLLLDGTWRYAEKMQTRLPQEVLKRSIPQGFQTAYPRRQEDCKYPSQGLASIEALYIAYKMLGRDAEALLKDYYWKELFLEKNQTLFIDAKNNITI